MSVWHVELWKAGRPVGEVMLCVKGDKSLNWGSVCEHGQERFGDILGVELIEVPLVGCRAEGGVEGPLQGAWLRGLVG